MQMSWNAPEATGAAPRPCASPRALLWEPAGGRGGICSSAPQICAEPLIRLLKSPVLTFCDERSRFCARVSAAALLCSRSISLRAVFRAWEQREQAGGCICQGTPFRGPLGPQSLQKHSPGERDTQKERERETLLFSHEASVSLSQHRASIFTSFSHSRKKTSQQQSKC